MGEAKAVHIKIIVWLPNAGLQHYVNWSDVTTPLHTFWGLKNSLGKIVGCFFKSSENFLSNEHKNLNILLRNGWDKHCQRYQPPNNKKKMPKFVNFPTHKFHASRTVWALWSHLNTWMIFFTKWTTSGKPPVVSKSPQAS